MFKRSWVLYPGHYHNGYANIHTHTYCTHINYRQSYTHAGTHIHTHKYTHRHTCTHTGTLIIHLAVSWLSFQCVATRFQPHQTKVYISRSVLMWFSQPVWSDGVFIVVERSHDYSPGWEKTCFADREGVWWLVEKEWISSQLTLQLSTWRTHTLYRGVPDNVTL